MELVDRLFHILEGECILICKSKKQVLKISTAPLKQMSFLTNSNENF